MPGTHQRRCCARCGAVLRRGNDGVWCSPCARVAVPELSSGFYEDPAVVDVLAAHEFGPFFRLARADLGLTQEQFGLLVGLPQSRVCKVENGAVRLRDIGAVTRVASALCIPPALLGFREPLERVVSRPLDKFAVAIAVVVTDLDVLMVCRRDAEPGGITWQFPAGIIKPGASAPSVAVSETLAETGVHCAVRQPLGRRVHPFTGANCDYYLCDFLAGEVENRDPLENVDALWVPKREVTRFAPETSIFGPIVDVFGQNAANRVAS
jgi:8-oxo-dGTP pyrophosphatase MutT (NUDIX family)